MAVFFGRQALLVHLWAVFGDKRRKTERTQNVMQTSVDPGLGTLESSALMHSEHGLA
jgi:hypothetical protein